MLAVAGPLNDGEVRRTRTMQLVYGINRSFKIRLNDTWHTSRCCVLDADVPHYINGDGDWQFSFHIYPDSHTGHLLKSTVLKNSPVSVFSHDRTSVKPAVLPSAVRPVLPFDLMEIFEQIIFLFTGRHPCVRPENPFLKEMRQQVARQEIISLELLARDAGLSPADLKSEFKRASEFDLDTWLVHRRMIRFFRALDERETFPSEDELVNLVKNAGIGGLDALDRLFKDFFGIPYSKWINRNVGTVILYDEKLGFPCFM